MKIKNSTLITGKDLRLDFNQNQRLLTHYISTEAVNCYGYVLKNSGMSEEEYRKNPVVLWQHELEGGLCSSMPSPKDLIIGKNLNLKVTEKGILAETQFIETPLANDIMELNRDGFLNAWSVRWDYLNDEETDLTMEEDIYYVNAWKPKEYSSVVLPGNPTAVNELKQMLSLTKTDRIKRFLAFDLAKAEVYTEIGNLKTQLGNIESLLKEKEENKDDNSINEKTKKDLKNEIDSRIGIVKKEMSDKILTLGISVNSLSDKLYAQLANNISAMIEKAIRNYAGKLD